MHAHMKLRGQQVHCSHQQTHCSHHTHYHLHQGILYNYIQWSIRTKFLNDLNLHNNCCYDAILGQLHVTLLLG